MKILLLIQGINTSDITIDDIMELLKGYDYIKNNFDRSSKDSIGYIDDSELLEPEITNITAKMIQYAKFEDKNDNEFKILHNRIYPLYSVICSEYITNYIIDKALSRAYDIHHSGNVITVAFVSNSKITKSVFSNLDIRFRYNSIYKIKINYSDTDDNYFDIILTTNDGIRDLSVQFDMLINKIKEDYSNV